ncbi:MAG: phosphotransferase enzyme family protein [Syntrophobacteraceae bacterium]
MPKDLSTRATARDHLPAAAERFSGDGRIAAIRAHGSGNVNDTFWVSLEPGGGKEFILQRINTGVFRNPGLIMQNMRISTEHAAARLVQTPTAGRRWEVPRVLSTADGLDYWVDPAGHFWRAISFIGNADSFDSVKDSMHAAEIGYALGFFHHLVSDLPPGRLGDTLEGFHVTPAYLRRYDAVLEKCGMPGSFPGRDYCSQFVSRQRPRADILEVAAEGGRLMLRTIHGDPKINNIMIDRISGQAVSIVDLDTVKPGLVQYDIGDCLRSCCNPLGEETGSPEQVRFEPDLCRAVLRGYFSRARAFLNEADYGFIYDAVRLIAFELGLRFFTDYLEGDIYFKVSHREHNLQRAIVQFRLAESIETQEASIRKIIRDSI